MKGGMGWRDAAQGLLALLVLAVALLFARNHATGRTPSPSADAESCARWPEDRPVPCLPVCEESLEPLDPALHQVCELPAYADFQQAVARLVSVRNGHAAAPPSGSETAAYRQAAAEVRQSVAKLKMRVDPALWPALTRAPFGLQAIIHQAGLSVRENAVLTGEVLR